MDQLNNLKAEIRGLLLSCPNEVPLSQFLDDYRKQVGVPFPSQSLGYSSPIQLLKNLGDVVKIYQRNGRDYLIPSGASKATHINDLVKNQRNSNSGRSKYSKFGNRNRDYWHGVYPSGYESYGFTETYEDFSEEGSSTSSGDYSAFENNLSPGFINNITALLKEHPNGIPALKLRSLYQAKYKVPLELAEKGFSSVRELILHLSDVCQYEEMKNKNDWLVFAKKKNSKTSKLEGASIWVPNLILDNLAILAKKYPRGISSNMILEFYEKEFHTKIDLNKLGFKSITSFLANCMSITLKQQDDVYLVLPSDWAYPNSPNKNLEPLPELNEMQYIWENFGQNFCDPSFRYQQHPITSGDFSQALHYSVRVSDANGPVRFYVSLPTEAESLNSLMEEINFYYNEENENLKMPEAVMKPQQACVSRYSDGKWYRAKIVEAPLGDCCQIEYVDYGTMAWMPVSEVMYLHKLYSAKPCYSIPVSLMGLPPDFQSYTEEMLQFCDKLMKEEFVMQPVEWREELCTLMITLADKKLRQELSNIISSYNAAQEEKIPEIQDQTLPSLPHECICVRYTLYKMFMEHKETVSRVWMDVLKKHLPSLEMEVYSSIISELHNDPTYQIPSCCDCPKNTVSNNAPFIANQSVLAKHMDQFAATYKSIIDIKRDKEVQNKVKRAVVEVNDPATQIVSPQPPHLSAEVAYNHNEPRSQSAPPHQSTQESLNSFEDPYITRVFILRYPINIIFPKTTKHPTVAYCSVLELLKSFSMNVTTAMLDHRFKSKGITPPYKVLYEKEYKDLFLSLKGAQVVTSKSRSCELLVIPLDFLVEFISVCSPPNSRIPAIFSDKASSLKALCCTAQCVDPSQRGKV